MFQPETAPIVEKRAEKKFEYTAEDIQRFDQARNDLLVRIRGLEGISKTFEMGYNKWHSSPLTLHQVAFTLAMSEHELVQNLLNRPITKDESTKEIITMDDVRGFIDAKILAGMKILDLGSGYELGFARWSRKFGAVVFTVDVIPANEFEIKEGFLTPQEREKEIASHIAVDLSSADAIPMIKNRSGGEFTLATEVNLSASQFFGGRNIAEPLLKTGGIYAQFPPPSYGLKIARHNLKNISSSVVGGPVFY